MHTMSRVSRPSATSISASLMSSRAGVRTIVESRSCAMSSGDAHRRTLGWNCLTHACQARRSRSVIGGAVMSPRGVLVAVVQAGGVAELAHLPALRARAVQAGGGQVAVLAGGGQRHGREYSGDLLPRRRVGHVAPCRQSGSSGSALRAPNAVPSPASDAASAVSSDTYMRN